MAVTKRLHGIQLGIEPNILFRILSEKLELKFLHKLEIFSN